MRSGLDRARRIAEDAASRPILRGDGLDDPAPRLGQKVDGADGVARLADAVRAAVALVELYRVPGDVVVDDDAGALQVQAFRGEVGGDEAIDGAAAEGFDGGAAVARGSQAAAESFL